jgi:hypothetical protein
VPILRRSNPGCNITLLTDQSTQFAGLPADVQVFRHPLDKARLGRNAWANYYQFRAQQARGPIPWRRTCPSAIGWLQCTAGAGFVQEERPCVPTLSGRQSLVCWHLCIGCRLTSLTVFPAHHFLKYSTSSAAYTQRS